jgi:hypothetical protein
MASITVSEGFPNKIAHVCDGNWEMIDMKKLDSWEVL